MFQYHDIESISQEKNDMKKKGFEYVLYCINRNCSISPELSNLICVFLFSPIKPPVEDNNII